MRGPLLREPKLNPQGVRAALAVESGLFPLAFGILALRSLWSVVAPLPVPQFGKSTLLEAAGVLVQKLLDPSWVPAASGLTRAQVLSMIALGVLHPILVFLFNAACAVLLVGRARLRTVVMPSRWREVLIPTAATFLLLAVAISDRLPAWLTRPLPVPVRFAIPLLGVAAFLTIAGLGIALWGLSHLRRNFSVFVEVRDVVTTGPYAFVRHPLYLGEITMAAGLLLCGPSLFGVALVTTLATLQLARARMEESRLTAASPAYATLSTRTGRLLPRFARRG